jgi:hypothetical protein
MSWAPALLFALGVLILICCAIVAWPRKGETLGKPHRQTVRDCYKADWK